MHKQCKPYFASLWRHRLFLFFTVGELSTAALLTVLESLVIVAAACKDSSIKACCEKQETLTGCALPVSLLIADSSRI